MDEQYSVYMHKNKINGKVYIGQTSLNPPEKRWRNGLGYNNQNFYKAIQKYGWDNFEHIILESNLTSKEANEKEIYYIKFYNSTNPDKGYNLTSGGKQIDFFSEEAKQKIKESWTDEKRKQYSERLKERWKNDKNFQEKSRQGIGRWYPEGELNPMYGKNRQGKNAGNKKAVRCIETGEIFDTIVEASKWANNGKDSLKAHISAVCKGKRNTSGKHPETGEPLHWEYIILNDNEVTN